MVRARKRSGKGERMRKDKVMLKPAALKNPSEIPDDELNAAYDVFRARAKSWPKRKRQAGHARFFWAFERRRRNGLRRICNHFRFWLACPNKVCARNESCSGDDALACFDRFWPLVPERLKFEFRGLILALNDGLTADEAMRKVKADWERMEGLARELAQGTAASNTVAEEEQPSTPMQLPPRAHQRGPRARML
jgi:hypothetical protein